MEHPATCPRCVAGDSSKARGVSRAHLRSVQPADPSSCSEWHADELPAQTTDWDDDIDGPPPTLLAW